MLGPSLVLLGLGLGSGELILWPYLVSRFGLGIIWAAVVGIGFQFFVNMEIERYSLARGESVFVGFARYFRGFPYWFILSTFFAWIWPGIVAVSAKIFAYSFGVSHFEYLGIALLLLIGVILTLGPKVYKTIENFQKIAIGLGVPLVLLITLVAAKGADWQALSHGLIGIGEGYLFLPKDIPLLVFLGALAYSGAGGNLNLAQSFYIKEKGYGMCHGSRGISSVLTGKAERHDLEGRPFALTSENLSLFRRWWRVANLEHLIVFFLTGAVTIILLALLSYATTKGLGLNTQGVDFVIGEAKAISSGFLPYLGGLFLITVAVLLFGCQLTILDSTSRIMAENVVILRREINLSKAYYLILWLQIIAGIIVFLSGYRDPFVLVVTGAVINAATMFIHIGATYLLNHHALPRALRPSLWRQLVIGIAWAFFGVLLFYSLWSYLVK